MHSVCVALVLFSLASLIAGQGAPVSTYNTAVDCSNGCDLFNPAIWDNVPIPGSVVIIIGNGTMATFTTSQPAIFSQLNISGSSVSLDITVSFNVTGPVFLSQGAVLSVTTTTNSTGNAVFDSLTTDTFTSIQMFSQTGSSTTNLYVGSGTISSGQFTMVPNCVFTCVDCMVNSALAELTTVSILNNLVVGPNAIVAVHDFTAVTVVLAQGSQLISHTTFDTIGYVQLDPTSTLTATGTVSIQNLQTDDDTPPLSGSGTVNLNDATVIIQETTQVANPFLGTLVLGGTAVYIEFDTIALTNLAINASAVTITAKGLTLQNVVGNTIPGSIFVTKGSSTFGLELTQSLTVTGGIQAQGADVVLAPGTVLNCQEAAVQVVNGQLTTNNAFIVASSITVQNGIWQMTNSTVFSENSNISSSNLTLYSTGNAFNGGLTLSPGSTLSVVLAQDQIPLTAVSVNVAGILIYKFQVHPPKAGIYTVLQAESNKITGHFTGLPNPNDGESIILTSPVYTEKAITLNYEDRHGGKGGSKWWIALIVLGIVGAGAGGGYVFYQRRNKYQRIES